MTKTIEARQLSKRYIINHGGGKRFLRQEVGALFGQPSNPSAEQEEFWALKDVHLSVSKGEIVGIIGPNGSGKSTLLKILSGIVAPTTGEVILHGRVGSLLEVGAGFHPDLSGRENIYLTGAILGIKKEQIDEKFAEIVHFSGIGKFLDTPVKYYSSGMQIRLGFSVAVQIEPDIMFIDEALAVGDAQFQEQSLAKMREISKKRHRTIVIVSHNMDIIRQLCTTVLLFYHGHIIDEGKPENVIQAYFAKIGQRV